MKVMLPDALWAMIARAAKHAYPRECCGLIEGVREAEIGTNPTCRGRLTMSAPGGKTDVPREPGRFRFLTHRRPRPLDAQRRPDLGPF